MKFLMSTIVLASCSALGWYVYQDSLTHNDKEDEKRNKRPVSVQITHLKHQTIEERADLVGSLEALAEIEIRPRIGGYITSLPYDVGDHVEAGRTLIEIDDSKNQEVVASSEAALKVAKAQLSSKQKTLDLIKKNVTRQIELQKSGVATEQQLEVVRTELAVAQAEIDLEQARVDQAESQLLRSKLSLQETTVVAPIAGYVASRVVEVGDLAKADETVINLVDLRKVKTIVHVIEKDYQKVKVAQTASITVDAFPETTFDGTVVRIAPVLNPETRTAAVHIEIENKETLLKPGMHARVSIVFQEKQNAEVLPIAALINETVEEQSSQVFVVSGDPPQTQLKDVVIGIRTDDMVEIVSGISPKDQVVYLGNRVVTDGQKVSLSKIDKPPVVDDLSSTADSKDDKPAKSKTANTGE